MTRIRKAVEKKQEQKINEKQKTKKAEKVKKVKKAEKVKKAKKVKKAEKSKQNRIDNNHILQCLKVDWNNIITINLFIVILNYNNLIFSNLF